MPIAALAVLKSVPLIGVLSWQWQSFDLIFLYWMENVVIGLFSIARMVIRPYGHALELLFPLLLAPFFVLHYGAFCWGHGSFVISLFAPERLSGLDLVPAAFVVLSAPVMLYALLALVLVQGMDWARDVRRDGLGADSIRTIMVEPYHRIAILHVTILGAGFVLAAADEPVLGLVILVLVKTAFDLVRWRKDRAAARD